MAEEKNRYFEEVGRNLKHGGFETEVVDGDGVLPVRWRGKPLCKVTADGGVRYLPDDVQRVAGDDAVRRVTGIAKLTAQYMKLMEAAPPLKAKGLEGGYQLLAEFNGTVLAGQPTKYGVQFVTWERDFDQTSLPGGGYTADKGTALLVGSYPTRRTVPFVSGSNHSCQCAISPAWRAGALWARRGGWDILPSCPRRL